MSAQEKPLHVRVAEALGYTEIAAPGEGGRHSWAWTGQTPGVQSLVIPRYDTDWSATGPLIERYVRGVGHYFGTEHDSSPMEWWTAFALVPIPGRGAGESANWPTALVAVCNLILALDAAGKLEVPRGA